MNKKIILTAAILLVIAAVAGIFYFVILPNMAAADEEANVLENNTEWEAIDEETYMAEWEAIDEETDMTEFEPMPVSNIEENVDTGADYNIAYDDLTEEQKQMILQGELTMEDLWMENGLEMSPVNREDEESAGSGFDALFTSMIGDNNNFNWDDVFNNVEWGADDVNTGEETEQADLLQDANVDMFDTEVGPDGLVSDDEICPPEENNGDAAENSESLLNGVGGMEDDTSSLDSGIVAADSDLEPVVTANLAKTGDILSTLPIGAIIILFFAIVMIGFSIINLCRKEESHG